MRSKVSKLVLLFVITIVIAVAGVSSGIAAPGAIVSADTLQARVMGMPDTKAKVDSILSIVTKRRKDPSIEPLFKEAFILVEKLQYKNIEPRLYDAYGVFKRDFSDYSEALELHKKSLELARQQKDVTTEIHALNNIGVVFRRLDENSAALKYHLDALKLAEKTGDDFSESVSLNSIGNIHIALGNYNDAIAYFLKSLPIAQKAHNDLGISMNLNNIGEAYEFLGNLDAAKLYYEKSLFYDQKINHPKGIAICYNSLGNIYKKKHDLGRAISLFNQALKINESLGDKIYIANSYNNLGNAYYLQENYDMANIMFAQAVDIAKGIGAKSETRNAYEGLTKTAEALKDYEGALAYGKSFKLYSDSIVNETNSRHVRQMEAIYDSEKEKNQISLLEANRSNDRVIIFGSFILFILLFVSGILYYLRYRLLERNKGLRRELEIRSQIASDLHDDMGSSLSSIHIFSELLRKQGNGHSQDLLTKIEANAKDTLEALDDIIWLVKPSNDKFSNLGTHISDFAVPLFQSKDIVFDIDFPDSISELPLTMETRRNIFLIIKESVNNLAKYSECKAASIKAIHDGATIKFIITDDGKGFDPDMQTNRNGLKNLKSRAGRMNGDLQIDSCPGGGTKVELNVRLN